MKGRIVVITGPTATGKTRLGVELSLLTGGEVVSADSMQVYRGMDIGTAKPTEREMRGVRHHMLDVCGPEESFSVSRYVEMASECVDDILARGRIPFVVGGTGLYIDSLVSGRFFADAPAGGEREKIDAEYEKEGGEKMLARLRERDPESAARLHPNDRRRIVRALEIAETTGLTATEHNALTKKIPPRYDALRIGLTFRDRAELYARIDRRVDEMLAAGLEDEERRLLDSGVPAGATSMQAIGYKELADFIAGAGSLHEAAEKIKMESRRYAKRQLSWLRRNEAIRWLLWEKEPDFAAAVRNSTAFMEEYGIITASQLL